MRYHKRRLKELREAAQLTPAALAKRAGISFRTVYALEAGNGTPRAETLARLANALGVSVDAFFVPAPSTKPVA